jgi:hypothetical protein
MYELLKMCDAETRNMVMIGIPGSMWNNYMLEVTKKFKVHEKYIKNKILINAQ